MRRKVPRTDAVTARFNVAVKGVSLTLPSHLLNSNDDCKEMTMIIFMIADGKNQCHQCH